MPAPLDAAEVARRWAAIDRLGSIADAARELGITPHTLTEWSRRGRAEDPAIKNAMAAVNTQMVPQLVWAKTKSEDGISYSTLLKPAVDSAANLERIRAAFEGMAPAAPVIAPERVADDLLNLFPLFDVHWGMHAWGRETGAQDYDLKLAEQDVIAGMERVLSLAPMADTGVLLIGGDWFHADDNTAQTPTSKHALDVDGRMFKVMETAVRVLSYVIQRIQSRHRYTTIRVLRGNHDEHSHLVLTFALAERFRNDSSVTVERNPRDLFMTQWGRTGIFAHHGDKMKPVDLVLKLADACPFWSDAPHRYAYTGHKHRMAAERIGGVHWEQLDAFAPPDAYGSTWAGRRGLRAETFHRVGGRVLTAHDPLERL